MRLGSRGGRGARSRAQQPTQGRQQQPRREALQPHPPRRCPGRRTQRWRPSRPAAPAFGGGRKTSWQSCWLGSGVAAGRCLQGAAGAGRRAGQQQQQRHRHCHRRRHRHQQQHPGAAGARACCSGVRFSMERRRKSSLYTAMRWRGVSVMSLLSGGGEGEGGAGWVGGWTVCGGRAAGDAVPPRSAARFSCPACLPQHADPSSQARRSVAAALPVDPIPALPALRPPSYSNLPTWRGSWTRRSRTRCSG